MLYKLKGISKSFGELSVLKNLSFSMEEHKVTCILGPSGCGKTTLLNIVSGILKHDSGSMEGFEEKTTSYIFQEPRLLNWKTIRENIEYVLKGKLDKAEIADRVNRFIDMVQLSDFKDYYPEKISGGMQQRVAIARAFAYPSDILLMDEPFKSLDFQLKLNLYECFLKLWEWDKRTVLFVTHDIHDALMLGDEIILLSNKPTCVRERIVNKVAHSDRNLSNKELLELEKLLYMHVSGGAI